MPNLRPYLGAIVGFIGKILNQNGQASYIQEEMLSPQAFFVVLLPPIIFEAGYSLHKGNFFQNLGSIVIFAVFGTIISTLLVGLGLFLLGKLSHYNYKLGSIIGFYRGRRCNNATSIDRCFGFWSSYIRR